MISERQAERLLSYVGAAAIGCLIAWATVESVEPTPATQQRSKPVHAPYTCHTDAECEAECVRRGDSNCQV